MSDRSNYSRWQKGPDGEWRQEPKCANEVKLYMEGKGIGIAEGFKLDAPHVPDNGTILIKSTGGRR